MNKFTAYNENGNFADFEISECTVKCGHYGEVYYQELHEQVLEFREIDYDICPYCHEHIVMNQMAEVGIGNFPIVK